MGDIQVNSPPLPHYSMKCACQKPKNTSPCDALHVQEIVEMANSFPNKKRTGAKWKTANAPLTDWQCQRGEGRGEVRCLATDKKTVRLWPDWTTYKQLYLPFFSSPFVSLTVVRNKLENYCFCFRYT